MDKRRKTFTPHPNPSPRLRVEVDPAEEMPSARSILKTLVFGTVLGLVIVSGAGLIAFLATR